MKTYSLHSKGIIALITLTPLYAHAQNLVTDYVGFGVTSGTLYGFTDHATRVAIDSVVTSGTNHLATDTANNRLLYTSATAVNGLWAYDMAAGTETNLGTLDPVVGSSGGGASFYNGDYYMWDDTGSTTTGVVKVTFDSDGLIDTVTKPYGNMSSIGSLGDIAISNGGVMYMLNSSDILRSIDLNNPLATVQIIGDTGLNANGQLFFDSVGNLLTRQGSDWRILNPATALPIGTIVGPNALAYNDLSEGGRYSLIPEPSTALLLSAVGILGLVRRRRSAN